MSRDQTHHPSPSGLSDLVAVDSSHEQLGAIGCELINRLFVLVRNTLIFDLNNKALDRPAANLLETLAELGRVGEQQAGIGILDDNLSLNRQILKPDMGTFHNGQLLGRVYRSLKAQELQFQTSISAEELRAFMAALRQVIVGRDDPSLLSHLSSFKLVPLSNAKAGGEAVEIDSRIQVLRVYAAAVAVVSRCMSLAAHGQSWSPNLVRRIAYDLVDTAEREPDLLLGLVHLPLPESQLGAHLVRVAVLSIICVQKIGQHWKERTEAATIALCHHLSRASEANPLAEEGIGLDEEPSLHRVDPLQAAMALCSRGWLNEDLIRRVVGVYEATCPMQHRAALYHDCSADDLHGRVVSLADRFAALTESLSPDEALRVLLSERQDAEPDLTRVFVNAVGVYPVGTVVELESGKRAVVVEAPRRKRQLLRPVVQLLDGGGLLDLSQESGHGGIVRSLRPQESQVNVSHYFLL